MRSSNILILGAFGKEGNNLSGQTIKTRALYSLFQEYYNNSISYFDTITLKNQWFGVLSLIYLLSKSKEIIYLPGLNNLKYGFPILFFLSKVLSYNIHYFVIGGWLPNRVSKKKRLKKKLSRIKGIYVETDSMYRMLSIDNDLTNVIWFPNFRNNYEAKNNVNESGKLRMTFMSRITIDKGIDIIFSFMDSFRNSKIYPKLSIDFYGPIDPKCKEWFLEKISEHENISYLGIVPAEQAQFTLCNYDLMLFPTRYPGEGCPGAIIDANMASLPVIASNWKYNNEFIEDGVTGYLFNLDEVNRINEIISQIVNDRKILSELRIGAKSFSKKFTKEKAWEIISQTMNFR